MAQGDSADQKAQRLDHLVTVYEKIARLTEQELANAYEIIKMYEAINEYTRRELIQVKKTNQAQEAVSELGSEELKKSFDRITQLEEANKKLQEERSRIQ